MRMLRCKLEIEPAILWEKPHGGIAEFPLGKEIFVHGSSEILVAGGYLLHIN